MAGAAPALAVAVGVTGPRAERGGRVLRRVGRDRAAVVAALLLALIVSGILVLPGVLPYRYDQQSLDHAFEGPTARHPLGTDQYGRDLLMRLAYGGRISLAVGLLNVLAEVVLGGVLGGVAG